MHWCRYLLDFLILTFHLILQSSDGCVRVCVCTVSQPSSNSGHSEVIIAEEDRFGAAHAVWSHASNWPLPCRTWRISSVAPRSVLIGPIWPRRSPANVFLITTVTPPFPNSALFLLSHPSTIWGFLMRQVWNIVFSDHFVELLNPVPSVTHPEISLSCTFLRLLQKTSLLNVISLFNVCVISCLPYIPSHLYISCPQTGW